ncbi:UBP1-associated protein 2B [Coffea arabica]|uniref:UBP1-associated protein 2B n=1 Tax=Coffea arabica TaxID=13443 RepID=A0ABM4U3X9_COFAR
MAGKRKADDENSSSEDTSSSSSSEEEDSSSSGSGSESSSSCEEEEGEGVQNNRNDSSERQKVVIISDEEEEVQNNDDESSKKEKLRELLEPLSKDQILGYLKEEALKDPSILSRIVEKAESDPTHRKIFIHGLAWDATEDQLLQVFEPFGEVEELKLITDKVTGRAKGYAFLLFKTRAAAKSALNNPQKKIGNRTVSCQLAVLGPAAGSAPAGQAAEVSKRKLFVANVGPNANVERLRAFFGKFGEIEDGPLGLDPSTNKPRGYAIFVYKSVDGLNKALEQPAKLFEGSQLNCKKFVEGFNNNNNSKNGGSKGSNQQQNQGGGNHGLGINPGYLGSGLNAGGMFMQQNPGIGLVGNPMLAAALNQPGLAVAAMAGIGGNFGLNNLNPGMIGNYGPLAALLGLGGLQGAETGQSSVGANAAGVAVGTGSAQPQSDIGSSGMTLPS